MMCQIAGCGSVYLQRESKFKAYLEFSNAVVKP